MKATHHPDKANKYTRSHRKERHFYQQITALVTDKKGGLLEAVTLRLYGTASATYACVWARVPDTQYNGSGVASGYGFNRGSEAAENALTHAGFLLSEEIGGRGDRAMVEAVTACAKALYPRRKVHIHIAHG